MAYKLIPNPKRRTVLWARLTPIVEAGSRNISMAQPLLDLGDIGLIREHVRGGHGARLMHAEAVHFDADAGFKAVFQDDVAVDRGGIERIRL